MTLKKNLEDIIARETAECRERLDDEKQLYSQALVREGQARSEELECLTQALREGDAGLSAQLHSHMQKTLQESQSHDEKVTRETELGRTELMTLKKNLEDIIARETAECRERLNEEKQLYLQALVREGQARSEELERLTQALREGE